MSDQNSDDSNLASTREPSGRSIMTIVFTVLGSLGFTMVGLVAFVFVTCGGCK